MKSDRWDKYFLNLCNSVANNSTCLSRQIGAVLTRDNVVISTGYNGPARKIMNCRERCMNDPVLINDFKQKGINPDDAYKLNQCPRKILQFPSGEGLEYCCSVHAEKNCLLSAARNGICTKNTIMYLNTTITPCTQCYSALINAGVNEVVLIDSNNYDKTVDWLMFHDQLKLRKFRLEEDIW